jgi:trehalose 6-phosphate phosphatase
VLHALHDRLEGRLAVVSGRSLGDIGQYLSLDGVTMAGSHGGEFRPSGSTEIVPLASPLPAPVVEAMARLAGSQEGLRLESKPFSVALHYRACPEAGAQVLAQADVLAAEHGLKAKRGKMVVELLTPGADKGSAVTRIMQTPPFTGSSPLFVGDDVTDEDAFRSVLDHDGGGILVGPERATAALWRLDGVRQVHAWLKAALA